MAEIAPPNVGDILAVANDDDWFEFDFNRMRRLDEWGAVIALPPLPEDWDGSPIVNELGNLVGITRVRAVDGNQIAFGLPVRWLFDLFRGALSSQLHRLEDLERREESRRELQPLPISAEAAVETAVVTVDSTSERSVESSQGKSWITRLLEKLKKLSDRET